MKEKEFIDIIKSTLQNEYIGDDCAYLKDLGIVITQDSLVENVHFSMDYMTPYQLGYKSIMVNLSDIAASGAEPKYLTIALSVPSSIDNEFIEDFYKGAKEACGKNIKIVGGDITASNKIYISVCAIGQSGNQKISSRSNAKIGYKVIVKGLHGSSSIGLEILSNESLRVNLTEKEKNQIILSHLMPRAQIEFGKDISTIVKQDYAMMDTSDGLMDALSTIANQSNVLLDINFDKIPHDKLIENFSNWQNNVLFGGEDYSIVAVIPKEYEISNATTIGEAKEGCGVNLKINGQNKFYSKQTVYNKIFNHWK